MRIASCLFGLFVFGCEACHHGGTGTGGSGGQTGTPPPDPTCTVPGVERAHRMEPVTLPSGCRFVGGGSEGAPRVVRTDEELASALTCDGVPALAIDLATQDLYVVSYTMSPATVGNETLDDGSTVTFVTRFRHNCPGDPMPMPMTVTYGFLLPKGATRVYRSASCSLPEDC